MDSYITGVTNSTTGLPITANAYQQIYQGGSWDSFIIKMSTPLITLLMDKTVSSNYSDINSILIYTITVNNNNNISLTNINFIDTIPNATTMVPGSLVLDGTSIVGTPNPPGITIPYMGIGATSTIQYSVAIGSTIPSSNNITNMASSNYSGVFIFNSNLVTTTVCNAFLESSKLVNKAYADIGDEITYTITLDNKGNVTAYNIVLIDTIPNGTSFVEDSVYINGNIIIGVNPYIGITIPNMGAGVLSTLSFKVKVTS